MGALVRASRVSGTGPFWAAPICHPLPLLAVLVLAVNDHWLKGSGLPELLTGKLSDLCGLFFFPALLVAVLRGVFLLWGRPVPARQVWALLAPVVTGVGFTAANLSPAFNQWLGTWWGYKMMDPTDLLVLPVLALSWLWIRRCDEPET